LRGGRALTSSVPDTQRSLAFVTSFFILHLAAAAVFEEREARRRFPADRARDDLRPVREPQPLRRLHADGRRHCVWLAGESLAPLPPAGRGSVEPAAQVITLSTSDGVALVYAVPALAAVAALITTTSRGAFLAFAVGLLLAGLGLRRVEGVRPGRWP
jgi:hypothetical protein